VPRMHPVAAQIGSFSIGTHDLFTVLAILVGFGLYYRELRRRGWLEPRIVWISLAALLGAAIGARLVTAWERPDWWVAYAQLPLTQALEVSGKSIIGAIVGGYAAIVLSKRLLGYRRSTGDAYVLALPIATAIGRIGCYLSELPLGTPTSLPWGVGVDPVAAAAFASCPGCTAPMHPTMLYEIAFNIAAALVLWRWRDRVPAPGDALKLYLLGAGAFRFLVEFIRTSPRQALDLTAPQWVLLPLIALLLLHFARQARRRAWRLPVPPPAFEAAQP
jgi:phosphatidylglycerol:prolipoprotein diacylglycerol transferase